MDVIDGKATASTVYVVRVFGQVAAVLRARKCPAAGVYTKFYEVCMCFCLCICVFVWVWVWVWVWCVCVCVCVLVCLFVG